MTKFTFRLETLQKMRMAHRDQQRIALAEASRAEEVLKERRTELRQQQDAAHEQHRQAANEKYLDVNRLLEIQRYDVVLKVEEQSLTKQEILLSAETERRRAALLDSDREVRVLELLEEKQRIAHRREAQRLETKQLDEIAVMRRPRR